MVIGLYFWNLLKAQQGSKIFLEKESRKEMEKLQRLRSISLTEPLSEKRVPLCFEEIIGQAEGLKSLRAALCGPNPQHVIIYGPPGVGENCCGKAGAGGRPKRTPYLLLKKTPNLLKWMQPQPVLTSAILPTR